MPKVKMGAAGLGSLAHRQKKAGGGEDEEKGQEGGAVKRPKFSGHQAALVGKRRQGACRSPGKV